MGQQEKDLLFALVVKKVSSVPKVRCRVAVIREELGGLSQAQAGENRFRALRQEALTAELEQCLARIQLVEKAISLLPDEERDAVDAVFLGGMSQSSFGKVHGLSRASVGRRLRDAVERLACAICPGGI
jgi:DNA-directed RNA polymerase specialized sigma subunit